QPAGNTGWLTQTGTIFGGNPGWLAANTGAYLYEVTATDATSSATSYVAFHAFNNDSRREDINPANVPETAGSYGGDDLLLLQGNVTAVVSSYHGQAVIVGDTANNNL